MALKVLAFDGGHEIEKWKTSNREGSFRHAVQEISEAEYEHVKLRTNDSPPPDFIRIADRYYAVGDAAESYGVVTKKIGAARYKPNYIGVLMVSALSRAYNTGGEVEVVASHPPRDITWRDSLLDALLGAWDVECEGVARVYEVIKASAYDEPQGGLMNNILSDDGTQYQNVKIAEGRTLILDVGGGTVSMLGAAPGGWVDQGFRPDTIQMGIMNVIQTFETSLRENYPDKFQDAPTIDPRRLRDALATGSFRGGGEELPCDREVRAAKNILLNQIAQRYQQRAGGSQNWDAVLLTGGGTALLYADLVKVLGHKSIHPADRLDEIHMANVRGLRKLRNYYKHYATQEEPNA